MPYFLNTKLSAKLKKRFLLEIRELNWERQRKGLKPLTYGAKTAELVQEFVKDKSFKPVDLNLIDGDTMNFNVHLSDKLGYDFDRKRIKLGLGKKEALTLLIYKWVKR